MSILTYSELHYLKVKPSFVAESAALGDGRDIIREQLIELTLASTRLAVALAV